MVKELRGASAAETAERSRSVYVGAAFLMATSAIGPGFLTHTAVFTERLHASFGFVILLSLLLALAAQLNIWRIIAVARKGGPEIANAVLPGLGHMMTAAVSAGGLAFNVGNLAGAGLGLNAFLGWRVTEGALVSAGVVAVLFLTRSERAMDRFTSVFGLLIIGLALASTWASRPPLGEALVASFVPRSLDILAIVALVGGTVGGYISFAGGHRLLAGGLVGAEKLPEVTRSAILALGVVGLVRFLLFLAVLGVLASGHLLEASNPLASAFGQALPPIGRQLFGLVLWLASLTSLLGAAYTSVSFLRSWTFFRQRSELMLRLFFILAAALIFVHSGEPVAVLVWVGAANALVLPFALGSFLVAAHRRDIVGQDYRHPLVLSLSGAVSALATAFLAALAFYQALRG